MKVKNSNKKNVGINWKGSSKYLKKTLDLTKLIQSRLIIFAGLCCFFVFVLLVRFFMIQIVQNEEYASKLDVYSKSSQTMTTPRGEILDRNNQVLVGSRQRLNITYFEPQNMTVSGEWALAYKFAQQFDVDSSSLTTRDLKDLYLTVHSDSFAYFVENEALAKYEILFDEHAKEAYDSLISDSEWESYYEGDLSSDDIYYLRLDRITDEQIAVFDDELKNAWSVKQSMDAGTAGQIKTILSDVSTETVAYLTEHSQDFLGFDIEIDWERQYPFEDTLKSVFGTVTTSQQGLPSENIDEYLALGYLRNEKVGRSGLELQYEELLAGNRKIYDLSYDDNGVGILAEEESGKKGYDLMTTVDINLQMEVDQLLTNILNETQDDERREYMDRISVVVMDPNNGDVLSMSSMVRNSNDDVVSDPVSVYTHAYEPGSIVKGAVIYMGQTEEVIEVDEYMVDQPIKLQGTPIKASWKNLGYINDIQALAQSSNVYMIQTAIRLAGGSYVYDGPLYVKDGTFSLMRNYFSLFGLGVKTGLDVPNEAVGYTGSSQTAGNITDFAIGQYDTYTVMQLGQYASTIANGGTKYQPRLVSKAFEPGTELVVYENDVTVLSVADNVESIERVKQGLVECVYGQDGICYGLETSPISIAAKTGTAQATTVNDEGERVDSPHNSVIAYAPYDDPELAIGCLIPNAWNGDQSQENLCLKITREIIDTYYGYSSVFEQVPVE